MNRQYHAHRSMGGANPLRVGTIPLGGVFYVQDQGYWNARGLLPAVLRDPMIVVAFLNGSFGATRRDRSTGQWASTYAGNRTDLALLRSLRDGRLHTVRISDLQALEEQGLTKGTVGYPTRPNLQFYRQGTLLTPVSRPAPELTSSPRRKPATRHQPRALAA